ALGVRVQSITLLHIDEAGAGGNVKPRDEIRNPFTALVVALAPGIGALFWAMLFAWGITTVYEAGYDEAWAWFLLYLAVGTGMAAAPSGGDLGYAWHVIAKHPGQFLIGLGGSILAIHAALIEGVHSPRRGFERVLVSSLNLLVASSTFSFSAA
nr:hypothetical protein [Candidatus Sigynarchaeum springense]